MASPKLYGLGFRGLGLEASHVGVWESSLVEPLSVQYKLVSTIMPLEAVCMCVYMIFVHMFIMQTETNRYIGICIKYIYIYIHIRLLVHVFYKIMLQI